METYKKETVTMFESQAKSYEKWMVELLEKFASPDVDRFVEALKGPKVLDAGCGPGVFLEAFRNQKLDALGIDLSDVFIARCHEKGLNVRKMDIESPLLYPHSFHGIWSHSVIQHIPKERIPKLVQTLARLLTVDGLLFAAFPEGDKEGYVESANPGFKQWVSHFSEEEVEQLFGKQFERIHFEKQTRPDQKNYLVYLFRVKKVQSPAFRNF